MPTTATSIDWTALARSLGSITCENEEGRTERGGTDLARLALNALLGDEELVMAVSHYIDFRPGAELVRSVLMLLRPFAAMQECYRVYCESSCPDERRLSVGLLGDIADSAVLPWIDEFIDHDDLLVSSLWANVLDKLVYRGLLGDHESEVHALLSRMDSHSSGKMSEYADEIRSMLDDG